MQARVYMHWTELFLFAWQPTKKLLSPALAAELPDKAFPMTQKAASKLVQKRKLPRRKRSYSGSGGWAPKVCSALQSFARMRGHASSRLHALDRTLPFCLAAHEETLESSAGSGTSRQSFPNDAKSCVQACPEKETAEKEEELLRS